MSIESSIRQDRALAAYRFDAKRMPTLNVPTEDQVAAHVLAKLG